MADQLRKTSSTSAFLTALHLQRKVHAAAVEEIQLSQSRPAAGNAFLIFLANHPLNGEHHMVARKPLDATATGLMMIFCAILGLQQVAIKIAAPDIAPTMQIALRSGVGALLLGAFMLIRGEGFRFADSSWKAGLVVGVLFTLEYYFLGEALRFTSASHAVVFLYTAPIFSALLLHLLVPAERMVATQWLGIALAFAGVAVTFVFGDAEGASVHSLQGDVLAVFAGLAWGATTVVIRTSVLAHVPAKQTLMYQLVVACVALLCVAVSTDQTAITPTVTVLVSMGFQSIIVAFAGFLLWFWLLRHYVVSQVGALAFLTPLLGVGFGAVLLKEPVEPVFILGTVCVVAGIVLVAAHQKLRRLMRRIPF